MNPLRLGLRNLAQRWLANCAILYCQPGLLCVLMRPPMKSRKLILSSVLASLVLSAMATAQSKTEKVIAEARKPSALEHNLQVLTDEIGGRVPGSPAMDKAVGWAIAAFKVAGADSVHTEAFTMPS